MSWRPAYVHLNSEDYAEAVTMGSRFLGAWWLKNDIGFNVGRHSFHLLREREVGK